MTLFTLSEPAIDRSRRGFYVARRTLVVVEDDWFEYLGSDGRWHRRMAGANELGGTYFTSHDDALEALHGASPHSIRKHGKQ